MTCLLQVISSLPEKRGEAEHALLACRQYLEDLEELAVWSASTRDYLARLQPGATPQEASQDAQTANQDPRVSHRCGINNVAILIALS